MKEWDPPSSTITAVAVSGAITSFAFELAMQFGIEVRQSLVAASITMVTAVVGYLKKERRLPIDKEEVRRRRVAREEARNAR